MSDDTDYRLLIAFPDQSASFTHGVGFGIIYTRAKAGVLSENEQVHSANREVLIKMCESLNLEYDFKPVVADGQVYADWLYFTSRIPDKPKRGSLRVIK